MLPQDKVALRLGEAVEDVEVAPPTSTHARYLALR